MASEKNPSAVYHLQVTLRFLLPLDKLVAGLFPVTVSHESFEKYPHFVIPA
jgi:hypothetical protein